MKKTIKLSVLVCGLLLSACSSQNTSTETSSTKNETYPVTISNYSRSDENAIWSEFDVTFDQAPTAVVANVKPSAELLLHLGLADSIAGVGGNFGASDPEVEEEYASLNKLSSDYISEEVALSVNPDLIFGRGGLFVDDDWGVGTVPTLSSIGYNTYVQATSVTGATFDSVYEDITNLGTIFNVKSAADNFKTELQKRQSDLLELVSSKSNENKELTFAYLHNSEPTDIAVFAAGDESFFNDIFKLVGLNNIYEGETGEISVETLVESDPDVLIVPDWSTYETGVSGESMVQGVLANEKLSSMTAVKNKAVYAVDYNYMWGYGYQALTGMEILANELYN